MIDRENAGVGNFGSELIMQDFVATFRRLEFAAFFPSTHASSGGYGPVVPDTTVCVDWP